MSNYITNTGGKHYDRIIQKKYKKVEDKLNDKGYHVCNMVYYANEFEVCNADGEVLIDHLSLTQLEQLSNIL